MTKIIECAICGKQFETEQPHKKYCSFSCKEAGRKLQRMQWEKMHPGYNTEYTRKYRAEKRKARNNVGCAHI